MTTRTAAHATHAPTLAPFTIQVQPQTWVRDQALDTCAPVDFDIARLLVSMSRADRGRVVDALAESDYSAYDLDNLYLDAAAMGLVEAGFGPFEVAACMTRDEMTAWCADTPVLGAARDPLDATTAVAFSDLVLGDVFLVEDAGEVVEVTVIGPSYDAREIFAPGIRLLPCRRGIYGPHSTDGVYRYGPSDLARQAVICGRHGGAWGNDETCSDCTSDDGATR